MTEGSFRASPGGRRQGEEGGELPKRAPRLFPRLGRLLPKRGDLIVLFISVLIFAASIALVGNERPSSDTVTLKAGHEEYVYPLGEDRILKIEGPIGETIVKIDAGGVRFIDSPCRDKICIGMGAVSQNRQVVACLPNKVIATVRKSHAGRTR